MKKNKLIRFVIFLIIINILTLCCNHNATFILDRQSIIGDVHEWNDENDPPIYNIKNFFYLSLAVLTYSQRLEIWGTIFKNQDFKNDLTIMDISITVSLGSEQKLIKHFHPDPAFTSFSRFPAIMNENTSTILDIDEVTIDFNRVAKINDVLKVIVTVCYSVDIQEQEESVGFSFVYLKSKES